MLNKTEAQLRLKLGKPVYVTVAVLGATTRYRVIHVGRNYFNTLQHGKMTLVDNKVVFDSGEGLDALQIDNLRRSSLGQLIGE